MIIDQRVKVKWRRDNFKHYISKGYTFTKFSDEFEVEAKDLSKGSRLIIEYFCDYCKGEYQTNRFIENKLLIDHRKNYSKDCCNDPRCVKLKKIESSKVEIENSLIKVNPELAKEWHPIKNGELTPYDVSFGSSKKVWWVGECGHEWDAIIKSRNSLGSNCPYCKHLPDEEETLKNVHPKIFDEIHPTKNKNIDVDKIHFGTNKSVWWKCSKCENEWKCAVKSRTRIGTGCPKCSFNPKPKIEDCLLTTHPYLIEEWHPTLNISITPYDVTYGSQKRAIWICSNCKNIWDCCITDRTRGSNCPHCKESNGEKRIRKFLELNQIKFTSQFEIDGLLGLGGKHLRFDFALFDNELKCLIEYDGEYHFRKLHENDGYERCVEHDKRKNNYCDDNKVPLIRIPYWKFDEIEEILIKELTKYNLISVDSL